MRLVDKIWDILGRKTKTQEIPQDDVSQNVVTAEPCEPEQPQDPYDKDSLLFILSTRDYAWFKRNDEKKVILVNPKTFVNHVNGMALVSLWRGTGHAEWEALLAYLFIKHLEEADEQNLSEVDVSDMFNTDLKASKNREMTAEQVREHLAKHFEVVEELPEEVRVRFKVA